MPRQLVCVRDDLDPDLAVGVTGALHDMEDSTAGRKVLLAFQNTRRFDAIPEHQRIILTELRSAIVGGAEALGSVTARAGE